MAVILVHNLRLCQNHQFVVTELHSPDGLGEAGNLSIPDILRSDVELWGEGRPTPRRHRVDLVSAMIERVRESYRHYDGPASTPTRGTRTLKRAPYSLPYNLW